MYQAGVRVQGAAESILCGHVYGTILTCSLNLVQLILNSQGKAGRAGLLRVGSVQSDRTNTLAKWTVNL